MSLPNPQKKIRASTASPIAMAQALHACAPTRIENRNPTRSDRKNKQNSASAQASPETGSIGKQQRQILGPPCPHGGKAAIHACADTAFAIAKVNLMAGILEQLCEFNIFQDFARYSSVPAQRFINFTAHKNVLTIGGRLSAIISPCGVIGSGQFSEHQRHQHVFIPGIGFLLRGIGNRSACSRSASATAAASDPGRWKVSASVNNSQGAVAPSAP